MPQNDFGIFSLVFYYVPVVDCILYKQQDGPADR